jgi:hypothetical protein
VSLHSALILYPLTADQTQDRPFVKHYHDQDPCRERYQGQDASQRYVLALRHHLAQLIRNNPQPGQDIEKELIISSFAAGENDLGGLEYKLTKHL